MEESNIKIIYLKNIVDSSLKMVSLGLEEISSIDFFSLENYDVGLLFLTRGYELLLKAMICFKDFNDKRKFPTSNKMKSELGHDLVKLKKNIVLNYNCIPNNIIQEKGKLIQNDKIFLLKDENLNNLIILLSKYNISGRYFELDLITTNKFVKSINGKLKLNFSKVPTIKLKEMIYKHIVKKDPSLLNRGKLSDINIPWMEANRELVVFPLKKFLGTLVRQFELGILGNEAKKFLSDKKYSYLKTKEYKIEDKDLENLS